MNRSQQIAQTILEQMGGINKIRAMTSASNFCCLESGVQFSFKGCRKVNKCVVKLDPSDTYTMELWKINLRTGDCKMVYEQEGLYFDMLKPEFETETGLYLSL